MSKQKRSIAGLVLLEGVLLAGLIWLLTLNRTQWIIRMGIVQTDQLILLCWIAWGALVIGSHVGLLIGRLRLRQREARQEVRLTFAPDKTLSPAEIRAELMRFQAERPQLNELLEQGLDQLDNIARKQQKMAELLERNELSLLTQASGALRDAEQTLCRKLALVLNRALLCDPKEENSRRREAVYAEHAQAIRAFLAENEDVLNRCETLLTETVRYVENKKAGRESMDLQIMTGVIHSLANDGIRMDMQKGGATHAETATVR